MLMMHGFADNAMLARIRPAIRARISSRRKDTIEW